MPSPHLLVSVRDAAEAAAALAGGADLIDVKDPNRGSLGRADAATIAAVLQSVAGRVPVSAALGELRECPRIGVAADLPDGLSFVKWGLSGLLTKSWADRLDGAGANARLRTVTVAYADWMQADSPRPRDIVVNAVKRKLPAVLLDTFQKNGSMLLDWMSVDEITTLVRTCREAGVKVALAGSLTAAEIDRLRGARPDWFAVRGAACDGGRGGAISERCVRELAELVHSL